ncbi:MAG: UDP-N-acetylmuramoyl-L-alanyl-D-glutamate--2,6-diaminopimelate ligase [Bacteroidota bacterium]|nr:UDP-N-acetylmuramoyl-L-alanyl-D-glutamate--2,6-diaminopimelate ligase [Bacteroidota bacterium]
MKKLRNILPTSITYQVKGSIEMEISGFKSDSRKVKAGEVFVALKGYTVDGHKFIPEVLQKGIRVVLCETFPDDEYSDVCFIRTEKIQPVLADMLNAFYDYPSENISLVGITGTNGKTTVASQLYQLYENLGYKVGLISTIENRIHHKVISSTHTTPDIISLYELLNEMILTNCSHAFMEVSSHSVIQERIMGLRFSGAVFTNLTHDHLDFHGTFKNYIEAKKKFFDNLPKMAFALINVDDVHGLVMIQNTKARTYTYSINQLADFRMKVISNNFEGLHLKYKDQDWHSRLIGEFNAYNLTAVLATASIMGEDEYELMKGLSDLHSVEGRFDWFYDEKSKKIGVIDYAHTPDALKKILENLRKIRHKNQRIITVVGCGGNRDKSKRSEMAKIAVLASDHLILTSDNPRDEDPEEILKDMEMGISNEMNSSYIKIADREQAIKVACTLAKENDIILVAGKGHEKYQEIRGKKLPFDDKKILKKNL